MKLISLIVLLSFFACKPAEITLKQPVKTKLNKLEKDYQIIEKTELIPKQELKVVKDEWGGKYIKLLPGNHTVLKYAYTKKPLDKTLKDAGYNQTVWFSLGKKLKNQTFKPEDLQNNPVYVQIAGFRNSKFISVTNAKVSIKILNKDKVELSILIDPEYSGIMKKDIHQIISINK